MSQTQMKRGWPLRCDVRNFLPGLCGIYLIIQPYICLNGCKDFCGVLESHCSSYCNTILLHMYALLKRLKIINEKQPINTNSLLQTCYIMLYYNRYH